MPQFSIPCSVYRGGTSRGLFFLKSDLPADTRQRNRVFLTGIDGLNPSQVDGLGGATSSTSKVCVLAPSERPGVDADWTFFQLGVGAEVVDEKGTCGNLMAAAGAFAVDSGLVKVSPGASHAAVMVYSTNIKKVIRIDVPLAGECARASGGFRMPGIVRPGALVKLSIRNPGGEKTGTIQPLGPLCALKDGDRDVEATLTDMINPFLFVAASDFGLTGGEPSAAISGDGALMARLNAVRDRAAVAAGMAGDPEDAAKNSPAVPKIAMVAPARGYMTLSGTEVRAEDADILVKVLSMGMLHRTSPASGLYNLAAACLMKGTLPARLAGLPEGGRSRLVRIGHPDGVAEVRVDLSEDGARIEGVGLERTARRIMKGELYVPEAIRYE